MDGFSFGAVIGWSEQKTFVCFGNESDIDAFKAVRPTSCTSLVILLDELGLTSCCSELQDKRRMTVGVDFGLSLGDKGSTSASLDPSMVMKTDTTSGIKTKAFQLNKCV